MQETWEKWIQSLDQEDSLEEDMAKHSSILAWRIPWTEEHNRPQSIGSQRVKPNWNDLHVIHSVMSTSLEPHGLQPARLLCPWNSPGKNTGMDCHSFLQGSDLAHRYIFVYKAHMCAYTYTYSHIYSIYIHTHIYIHIYILHIVKLRWGH